MFLNGDKIIVFSLLIVTFTCVTALLFFVAKVSEPLILRVKIKTLKNTVADLSNSLDQWKGMYRYLREERDRWKQEAIAANEQIANYEQTPINIKTDTHLHS